MESPGNSKQSVLDILNKILADELVLGAKTRNYRWNISGSSPLDLQEILREDHQRIRRAMDRLARKILDRNGRAIGILGEGPEITRLDTALDPAAQPMAMVGDLAQGHETLVQSLENDLRDHQEILTENHLNLFLEDLLETHRQILSILKAIQDSRLHLRREALPS
jgi:starvation-inducible DNA-binding protein